VLDARLVRTSVHFSVAKVVLNTFLNDKSRYL
jgi:hypothetical protein